MPPRQLPRLANARAARQAEGPVDDVTLGPLDARDLGRLGRDLRPRCTKPRPPSSAIATAIRASVTLSMFAETSGRSRASRRVSAVPSGTSRRERERARLGAEQEIVVGAADELRLEGPAHGCLRSDASVRDRGRGPPR